MQTPCVHKVGLDPSRSVQTDVLRLILLTNNRKYLYDHNSGTRHETDRHPPDKGAARTSLCGLDYPSRYPQMVWAGDLPGAVGQAKPPSGGRLSLPGQVGEDGGSEFGWHLPRGE